MPRYEQDVMTAAAHFYFIENFSQEDIASRLGLSRFTVNRMLRKARETGLIHVTVKRPLPDMYRLALGLEKTFSLKTVRVVQTSTNNEETSDQVGRAGAELLSSLLSKSPFTIGTAWSSTVHAMLPHVRTCPRGISCRVNELAGTYLAPRMPYGVSWQLAERLNVPLESIPVPVLVKNAEAKRAMLKEESVSHALEQAEKVDVAFVGLGELSENSSLAKTGYLPQELREELRQRGAVGEILMRFYDKEGRYVHVSFEDQVMSLAWDKIRKIPLKIALAYGPSKAESIRGALAGGIIQGLVTDRETAELLLRGKAD